MADDEKSTNQILQALDALSHTIYKARANRRTTSLALPRSAADGDDARGADFAGAEPRPRPRRRLSLMSPFRSRSKLDKDAKEEDDDDDDDGGDEAAALKRHQSFAAVTAEAAAAPDGEKKAGIWSWGPIRALSHIGMQRMGCLFSAEVVAAQGLPPSMNGLRLAVAVRKKETRDGAVQTMAARVQQGAADFDETLFVRCHLYGTGGGASGKPLTFEPRPFLLTVVAVDAPELDLGRSTVDLSLFAKEFTDKCQQGECVRQWDMAFPLVGKAKGGELVIKLAFQTIDDGGAGLYSQPAGAEKTSSSSSLSSFTRRLSLSKSSFSVMLTPKMTRMAPSLTPKKGVPSPDLKDIDNFKLDEPTPVAEVKETPVAEDKETPVAEAKETQLAEDKETPVAEVKEEQPKEAEQEPEGTQADDDAEVPEFDFDIVDKGVEEEKKEETDARMSEPAMLGDVLDEAAKSVETVPDEATGPDANELPKQGEDKDTAAKPRPRGPIGWRTIAILVTPIAVFVGRTLATTR